MATTIGDPLTKKQQEAPKLIKVHNGKRKRVAPLSPTSEGQVKYKEAYVGSLIPGLTPVSIKQNGSCEYSDEQLEEVREALPSAPIEGHDRAADYALREKQVAQVELLLLKGVTNQNLIANILQVSRQHVAGLVKAAHTRWEVIGGPRNSAHIKGEALAKLTLMENEYWTIFQKDTTKVEVKASILSSLMQVIDRKLLIHGLSPRVLENVALEAPGSLGLDEQSPMDASMSIQRSLADATRNAMQLIAEVEDKTAGLHDGG